MISAYVIAPVYLLASTPLKVNTLFAFGAVVVGAKGTPGTSVPISPFARRLSEMVRTSSMLETVPLVRAAGPGLRVSSYPFTLISRQLYLFLRRRKQPTAAAPVMRAGRAMSAQQGTVLPNRALIESTSAQALRPAETAANPQPSSSAGVLTIFYSFQGAC